MATNIKSNYLGGIYIQSGDGIPIHLSPLGSLYIDLNIPPSGYLSNGDGTWNGLGTISSGTSGFDVYVTGGTYNAGTAVFTNNTGGTFSVTGFSTSNATEFTGGTVTGSTQFTGGLTANTISATTIFADNILSNSVIVTGTTSEVNINIVDYFTNYSITGLSSNVSISADTANNFDKLIIRIKDDGNARIIRFDSNFFEAKGQALPTTTIANLVITIGFIFDNITNKWGCISVAQEI